MSRLEELWAKVDAFVARVDALHPGELACGPGCDDCCQQRLSVTGVEAARIVSALAAMDALEREEIARRASIAPESACAALDENGRCGIYAVRPLVCRSHGVPIRYVQDDAPDRRHLPLVDACFKNFVGCDLTSIDRGSVLDQVTLSTLLSAVDAADADETRRPRGERFELEQLLSGLAPRAIPRREDTSD